MLERPEEQTPLIILRDYIRNWLDETDGLGTINPMPGTKFSYIEDEGYRGGARIADWLIVNRFYFWGQEIPGDLFHKEVTAERRVLLIGRLREAMLCYEFNNNEGLRNLSQVQIRSKYREEWCSPSTTGRMIGGKKRTVLGGLEAFLGEHAGDVDAIAFNRFMSEVSSEVGLFEGIKRTVDETALLDSCYKLLVGIVLREYKLKRDYTIGRRNSYEGNLHIGAIDFWDDEEQVGGLISILASKFGQDLLIGQYAEYFKESTVSEFALYREKLSRYEDALDRNDTKAVFQSILAGVASLPQLFEVLCGKVIDVKEPDGKDLLKKLGKEIDFLAKDMKNLRRRCFAASFLRWVLCSSSEIIPEWAKHKANVIWNILIGCVVSPRLCKPAPSRSAGTQVVSDILEGVVFDDAIVAGTAPVRIFDISNGASKKLPISEFDLGSRKSPRPDGIVKILGRMKSDPDPLSLCDKLGQMVDEAFALESQARSQELSSMMDELRTIPVQVMYRGVLIDDEKGSIELQARLQEGIRELLALSGEMRERGGKTIEPYTIIKKEMNEALTEIIADFYGAERSYNKAALERRIETTESDESGLIDIDGAGMRIGLAVKIKPSGRSCAKMTVAKCVNGYLLSFKSSIAHKARIIAEAFCDADEYASETFRHKLLAIIERKMMPEPERAPRAVSKIEYLQKIIPEIAENIRFERDAEFIELGFGRTTAVYREAGASDESGINSDMSVSREQLVIEVRDGRAVLRNLSRISPSYIKRSVHGETVFYIFGVESARKQVVDWVLNAGYARSLDDGHIFLLEDNQTMQLRRGDIVHLGARTELEFH